MSCVTWTHYGPAVSWYLAFQGPCRGKYRHPLTIMSICKNTSKENLVCRKLTTLRWKLYAGPWFALRIEPL